jgi:hypothetical protein
VLYGGKVPRALLHFTGSAMKDVTCAEWVRLSS